MTERKIDGRTRALVEPCTQVILKTHVEPTDDIAAERARASFNSNELAAYMNDGEENLKRKDELVAMAEGTQWGDKSSRYFLTREQEYVNGLKAALGIWDTMQKHNLTLDDGYKMRQLVSFPGGLELHIGMFIPSLLSQASPEQQEKWLPLANTLKIIGTYAQTELGHGTFVRGLETTATYDKETGEFVVNSPTLTSTKWWPGGLGKTATHVILMARLFTDGKDYGPHGFIVQIRTLDTHLPLPGIKIGDIGPKFGYNGVDNGYLSFDHVRIPREVMLMRFAKVTPEGKYVPPPPSNAKASYATMVYVRATIVEEAGHYLSRAVTIGVRYNAVRRQTTHAAGQKELQVLDYQNTAAELLPLVASAYALTFMGKAAMNMYKQFEGDRDRGDFTILPELHALLSGLKALGTWITSDGIEAVRRCCGGHGYSHLSGLPNLYASYVQNATWEGDNNVLCLQTARYLIKALVAAGSGTQLAGSSKYLEQAAAEMGARCQVDSMSAWMHAEPLLEALRHVATRLCGVAAQSLVEMNGGQLALEGPAWNSVTVDLIAVAKAHSAYVLAKNFVDTLAGIEREGSLSPPTRSVLRSLAVLFCQATLRKAVGDALEDGYMSSRQAANLRAAFYQSLRVLRPEAVALVDGFGLPDYQLNSAIGRRDGNVYQALLDMAQGSPLNATQEGPAWHGVLEPLLNPASRDAAKQARSRL